MDTDVGTWTVYETPGHAPSHVVLHQPERRLLHLGRPRARAASRSTSTTAGRPTRSASSWPPSTGSTASTSASRCRATDARSPTSRATSAATASWSRGGWPRVLAALREQPEATAFALLPDVYGEDFAPEMSAWLLTKVLCYLDHLERRGEVRRLAGEPERWAPAA